MKLEKNNNHKNIKGKVTKTLAFVLTATSLVATGCTKKISKKDLILVNENYEEIEEIINNNPSYREALVIYQPNEGRYERHSNEGINFNNSKVSKTSWIIIDDNKDTDNQTRTINNKFLFYRITELGLIESAYFYSIDEAIDNGYYYYNPKDFVATVITYDDKNKEYFEEDIVNISGYNEDTKTYTYHR